MTLQREELIFGLIGAVGSDIPTVANELEKELNGVGYESHHISLSNLMRKIDSKGELAKLTKDTAEDERVNAYMDFGNNFREHAESGSAVAQLAVQKIANSYNP